MVGHGAGLKPVTVAPSVTKEEREQTDAAAEVPVGVMVGGGGMWLNVLEDATASVTVVREVDGQAMNVGTAAATRDLPAIDLSLTVTVFVAGLVDVFLVCSAVGYGLAGVTIGTAPFFPSVDRSVSIGATLLNFMAGPKHCLLKACPLVHSVFGDCTKSVFAKL